MYILTKWHSFFHDTKLSDFKHKMRKCPSVNPQGKTYSVGIQKLQACIILEVSADCQCENMKEADSSFGLNDTIKIP